MRLKHKKPARPLGDQRTRWVCSSKTYQAAYLLRARVGEIVMRRYGLDIRQRHHERSASEGLHGSKERSSRSARVYDENLMTCLERIRHST
jgi:hypothetical protein